MLSPVWREREISSNVGVCLEIRECVCGDRSTVCVDMSCAVCVWRLVNVWGDSFYCVCVCGD